MEKEVKSNICFEINPERKRAKKINQLEDIKPKIIQRVSKADKNPREIKIL